VFEHEWGARRMTSEVVLYLPNSDDGHPGEKDKKLVCKFILLGVAESLILVGGTWEEFPYHANLIDRFCRDREIAVSWVKKPDLVEIHDSSVRTLGGGWLEIDTGKSLLKVSGRSTAYGRYRAEDFRDVIAADPIYSRFEIILSI
jgi:hypothetical protein